MREGRRQKRLTTEDTEGTGTRGSLWRAASGSKLLCFMEVQFTNPKHELTPAEYLAAERLAEHKSEYYNGEVQAMAGGKSAHSRVAANLIAALGRRLDNRPCQTYTSDMLVHPSPTEFFYPDVTLLCGEEKFLDASEDCLLNPNLVAEVLSPSTRQYDREKFFYYQQIPALNHFLLIHQDRAYIEHFVRTAGGEWAYKPVGHLHDPSVGLQVTLALDSLSLEIPLSEIYRLIKFPPSPTPPSEHAHPD